MASAGLIGSGLSLWHHVNGYVVGMVEKGQETGVATSKVETLRRIPAS